MQELKNEIRVLQSSTLDTVPVQRLENVIVDNTETLLSKYRQEQNALLEEVLRTRDSKERQNQESLMSAISQAVGNLITSKLDEIITTEMKENIMPGNVYIFFLTIVYVIYVCA